MDPAKRRSVSERKTSASDEEQSSWVIAMIGKDEKGVCVRLPWSSGAVVRAAFFSFSF